MVILHWNKLERWKGSVSGCHRSWLQILKNCLFEVSSSLILCNCTEPFLDQTVTCDEKWILYNQRWLAQWLDLEAPKQACTKKRVMICLVVGSAVSLIHYSFLNPGETITSEKYTQQIDERHWKLQHLQPLEASIGQQKALSSSPWQFMSHNNFKSWTNWAMTFCLTDHIHLTSQQPTTSSSIMVTFCRENTYTTLRMQEMLCKSSLNPKGWIFMLQE